MALASPYLFAVDESPTSLIESNGETGGVLRLSAPPKREAKDMCTHAQAVRHVEGYLLPLLVTPSFPPPTAKSHEMGRRPRCIY
jgi:hypothetical protein